MVESKPRATPHPDDLIDSVMTDVWNTVFQRLTQHYGHVRTARALAAAERAMRELLTGGVSQPQAGEGQEPQEKV